MGCVWKPLVGLCIVLLMEASSADEWSSRANPGLILDRARIKNNRPIIGILTQEATAGLLRAGEGQVILASYVKMVESAGARAAPIFVDRTPEEIEKMFHSVSGVVFPGGHIKLNASRYAAVGKQILELAIKENLKGEVFPVWAECLGLELISMIISGVSLNHGQYKNNLLHYTDARNLLLPLKLTPDFRQSKLFGTASQQLIDHIQSHPIAYNNHIKGISPKKFHRYKRLSNMFRIVSTNVDRQGSEFIATLEGREMPLFLFHWHPSKPMFEWSTEKVFSHSQEAIWLGQHVADVFINQARQSGHRFPTRREEARALIYNYPVTYTGVETTFMQAYFFQMTNRNASALP